MTNETITCPSCNGRKRGVVLVYLGDGCEERVESCLTCKGTGTITPEQQRHRELGKQIRARRLENYVTQWEASKQLGISVVTYSQLEQGRLDDDELYATVLGIDITNAT